MVEKLKLRFKTYRVAGNRRTGWKELQNIKENCIVYIYIRLIQRHRRMSFGESGQRFNRLSTWSSRQYSEGQGMTIYYAESIGKYSSALKLVIEH